MTEFQESFEIFQQIYEGGFLFICQRPISLKFVAVMNAAQKFSHIR